MLQSWQEGGGIMIMGYEMVRNLVQHRFIKNKKQKKIFTETILEPGKNIFPLHVNCEHFWVIFFFFLQNLTSPSVIMLFVSNLHDLEIIINKGLDLIINKYQPAQNQENAQFTHNWHIFSSVLLFRSTIHPSHRTVYILKCNQHSRAPASGRHCRQMPIK